MLREVPVGTEVEAEVPVAHIAREVIVAALTLVMSELHLLTSRVALAQIAVVGVAGELIVKSVREVGTELQSHCVRHAERSLQRQRYDELLCIRNDIAREESAQRLAALAHLH